MLGWVVVPFGPGTVTLGEVVDGELPGSVVAPGVVMALAPRPSRAFCGFFVSGADQKLYNSASHVVLMRKGNMTIMTMSNDYQGPPGDFAMVVPVPVVLHKKQVRTLAPGVFRHI